MIFKIQRSIMTNAPQQMCLIYNCDRTLTGEIPLSDNIARLFRDGEHKIYVDGSVNRNGHLTIKSRVKPRTW